jgi:hypothetical protein
MSRTHRYVIGPIIADAPTKGLAAAFAREEAAGALHRLNARPIIFAALDGTPCAVLPNLYNWSCWRATGEYPRGCSALETHATSDAALWALVADLAQNAVTAESTLDDLDKITDWARVVLADASQALVLRAGLRTHLARLRGAAVAA